MFLSESDRDTLLTTLNAKSPELIQARMANALLLLAEGLSTEDVAGLLYLDEASVIGWKTMFSKRNWKAAQDTHQSAVSANRATARA
jgi:transposase